MSSWNHFDFFWPLDKWEYEEKLIKSYCFVAVRKAIRDQKGNSPYWIQYCMFGFPSKYHKRWSFVACKNKFNCGVSIRISKAATK